MPTRDEVRGILPELELIGDEKLREKTLDVDTLGVLMKQTSSLCGPTRFRPLATLCARLGRIQVEVPRPVRRALPP